MPKNKARSVKYCRPSSLVDLAKKKHKFGVASKKDVRKIKADDLMACAIFLSFIYIFVERMIGWSITKSIHPIGIQKFFYDYEKLIMGAASPLPWEIAVCVTFSLVFVVVEDKDDGFRKLVDAILHRTGKFFEKNISVFVVCIFVLSYVGCLLFGFYKLELSISITVFSATLFLFYCYYLSDGFVIKFTVLFSLVFIMISILMSTYILYSKSAVVKEKTWMYGNHWYVKDDVTAHFSDGTKKGGEVQYVTDDEILVEKLGQRLTIIRSSANYIEINKLSGSEHYTAH